MLATVTGKVGYAHGRWLAYGKGGWAGADVELTLFDRTSLIRAHSDTWANGWAAGGGLEYAIYRGFSLGVEYSFIDLETGRQSVIARLNFASAGRCYFAPNTRAKIVSTCFR